MAKFYGNVGFIIPVEKSRGLWIDSPQLRPYAGDFLRMTSQWSNGEGSNDDLKLGNRVSFVADPFAHEHFSAIRFVELGGARWQVTNVEVAFPRLILTIGGVYNNVHDET